MTYYPNKSYWPYKRIRIFFFIQPSSKIRSKIDLSTAYKTHRFADLLGQKSSPPNTTETVGIFFYYCVRSNYIASQVLKHVTWRVLSPHLVLSCIRSLNRKTGLVYWQQCYWVIYSTY